LTFEARVRRVGGVKDKRPAVGITIPSSICKDLNLKIGDVVVMDIKRGLKTTA